MTVSPQGSNVDDPLFFVIPVVAIVAYVLDFLSEPRPALRKVRFVLEMTLLIMTVAWLEARGIGWFGRF